MDTKQDTLLIWGSGSQAMIYLSLAKELGRPCVVVDPRRVATPDWARGIQFFGREDSIAGAMSTASQFLVAIGGEHGGPRHSISLALEDAGLTPISLIDESSDIKNSAKIGAGSYIGQKVIVNIGTRIGRDAILNTGCSIDHECSIGVGVHIMGAAALAGRVKVGDFTVIGTNATILPDISVGRGAYIGAGAVITKDVVDNAVVVGVPGRTIRERVVSRDEVSVQLISNAMI